MPEPQRKRSAQIASRSGWRSQVLDTRTVYVQFTWSEFLKPGKSFGRIDTLSFVRTGVCSSGTVMTGEYRKEPRWRRGFLAAKLVTPLILIAVLGSKAFGGGAGGRSYCWGVPVRCRSPERWFGVEMRRIGFKDDSGVLRR